jgi:hypothetical protein
MAEMNGLNAPPYSPSRCMVKILSSEPAFGDGNSAKVMAFRAVSAHNFESFFYGLFVGT